MHYRLDIKGWRFYIALTHSVKVKGVNSKLPNGRHFLPCFWHAYCFRACTWGDALKILADTRYLDQVYFKIGAIRGYFTLRYSPKKGREIKPAQCLESKYKEDVDPYTLTSGIEYWTRRV